MITIKKYTNRKLYVSKYSTYVNLDKLRQMLLHGQTFKVEFQGKDITRETVQKINLKYGLPKEIIVEYI